MRQIWKSSIARSLFSGFVFLIIPSLLISFIANYINMSNARIVVMQSYENYMTLLTRQLDDRLGRFQSLGQVLLADETINYINEYPVDDTERILGYAKLLNSLQLLTYTNEFDGEITVYLKNKQRKLTSRLGVAPLENSDPALAVHDGDSANRRWRVTAGAAGERLTYIINPNPSAQAKNTVVKIEINVASMQRFLSGLDIPGDGAGFLVDGDGGMIAGASPFGIHAGDVYGAMYPDTGPAVYEQDGKKYHVLYQRSATGLQLVLYYPQDILARPIIIIRNWLIAATGLSVFLAFGFTVLTYRNLLMPIQRLIAGMRRVSAGDLKARIEENEKEDLGFMFHQFNTMTGRIDQLVNDVYVEKIKNQQAQLDFLQSQINPHFLYNSLYTIYHLINSDDQQAAGSMTLYLGDYFRLATRMRKEIISGREEMAMIETYINIQKMRFPDKIAFHVAMEDGIADVMIPRLVIQPLVENALVHGLEKANRNGNIWVTGAKHGDHITISIEDDGKGMDAGALHALQQSLDGKDDAASGCGLINTHRRIRLRYGPQSGLTLEHRPSGGMRATIALWQKE